MEVKQATPVSALCKGLPEEFGTYLSYTRSLGFEDAPDYEYCRQLFTDGLRRIDCDYDFKYDWVLNSENPRGQVENPNDRKNEENKDK